MAIINNREKRIKIAKETLEILDNGFYINGNGDKIDIKDDMDYSISNSVLYKPDFPEKIKITVKELLNKNKDRKCLIEVTGETTIAASLRLVNQEAIEDTACLNFASAKNPGGGFLTGSQAQEESLARSSGLYPCISQMSEMYEYNRNNRTCLYSDYMIYSPKVPFIRYDNGKFMDKPVLISVITAPAVNAGIVMQRSWEDQGKIGDVMVERIRKILSVAAVNKCRAIVLGAFGCGVFKNKPEDVAGYFERVLFKEGYNVLFDRIVFAVYEIGEDKKNFNIFNKVFSDIKSQR
ncbi:MAG TPA: TIGR02452 family protein [Pseudobacteroides sp.]|nr:TIGR02452 family protein [Pseudobacteroides sp.]